MNKSRSIKGIIGIAIIAVFIMYILEGIIATSYFQKSLVKIIIFLTLPILYSFYDKNIKIRDNFKIKSIKNLKYSFALGIGMYLGILLVYFLLRDFINLTNIMAMLDKKVSVNGDNFLWIALYISIINSLLEEFFFRGFIFLNLKKISGRKFSYIVSAFILSIYHVAIMGRWFSPSIFILAMLGLFIGALIFNYLNEKEDNIYNSWIVHMMANLSINTIGLMMFGIL